VDGQVIIGGLVIYCLGVLGMYMLLDIAYGDEVPHPVCFILAIIWPVTVPVFGALLLMTPILALLKGSK